MSRLLELFFIYFFRVKNIKKYNMSENDLYVLLGKLMHSIGLLSASLVILTLIAFSIVDASLLNKLTIRIMIPLAFADFIVSLSELLGLGSGNLLGTWNCQAISGLRYFGRLLYSFTNIGMCFNLYRCIIKLKQPKLKLEIINWLITLTIITIAMAVFGSLGSFSDIEGKKSCRPGTSNRIVFQIEEGIVGGLAMITVITCLTVYFTSRSQFNKSITLWAKFNIRSNSEKERFIKKRRKMLERSFLYPLATVVTLPATIALSIMDITGVYYDGIYIALSLTQSLSGISTLFAFLLDPNVIEGLRTIYHSFRNSSNIDDDFSMTSEN